MKNAIRQALVDRGLVLAPDQDLFIKTAAGKEISVTDLFLEAFGSATPPENKADLLPVVTESKVEDPAVAMARELFVAAYAAGRFTHNETENQAEHFLDVARRFYTVVDPVLEVEAAYDLWRSKI